MNRREFLKVSALAGGGMMLGISFAGCASRQQREMADVARQSGAFRPNMYLTITPDDRVLVDVEKSEMGQGVLTSHSMLVAEELSIDLDRIEASSAPAAPQYRTNYGMQQTGNSASVAESYVPVRKAAAAARMMLVAAAAKRWGVSPADCAARKGRVRHKKSGRQLRYGELVGEAAKLEIPDDPPIKSPDEFEVLGTGKGRVDAVEKVDGSGVFGIDVEVDGLVKALVIHPPVFGARPRSVEAKAAKEMDGVVDIVPFERGVAVVAEKYWQAKRAAAAVEIEWGSSRADGLDTDEVATKAAEAARKEGSVQSEAGDIDDALADPDVRVVEAEYSAPFLAHSAMEPQNCTAHVRDGEVEIWAPTQGQTVCQEVAARIADVDREDVTVHTTLLGGGFGRRVAPDFVFEAVSVSKAVGRPVQVIWSREDDTRGGYYRPINHNAVRAGLDEDGMPVAWYHHHVSQPIIPDVSPWVASTFPDWVPMVARRVIAKSVRGALSSGSTPELVAMEGAHLSYDIPNTRLEFTPVRTPIPVCFWRSVGHSYNAFVVESFIDELAHAADQDPVAYRRELLDDEHKRLRKVLEVAAEHGNWGGELPEGFGRGVASHSSFGSHVAEVIEAGVVDGKIVVDKVVCAVDCGMALNPDIVRAQMESGIIYGLSAAIEQKITVTDGQIDQGNFDTFGALRMHQSPDIEVHIVDSGNEPSGVGEPGLPPAAPALANALFDATGMRLRSMPFDDALSAKLEEPT